MERRAINPWTWQDAMGFVQAMELGPAKRTLLCSGQTSVDANGAPVHAGDMAAQLRLAVANLETERTGLVEEVLYGLGRFLGQLHGE